MPKGKGPDRRTGDLFENMVQVGRRRTDHKTPKRIDPLLLKSLNYTRHKLKEKITNLDNILRFIQVKSELELGGEPKETGDYYTDNERQKEHNELEREYSIIENRIKNIPPELFNALNGLTKRNSNFNTFANTNRTNTIKIIFQYMNGKLKDRNPKVYNSLTIGQKKLLEIVKNNFSKL